MRKIEDIVEYLKHEVKTTTIDWYCDEDGYYIVMTFDQISTKATYFIDNESYNKFTIYKICYDIKLKLKKDILSLIFIEEK